MASRPMKLIHLPDTYRLSLVILQKNASGNRRHFYQTDVSLTYSAAFSSVAGASVFPASAFFLAAPERRVFLAAVFTSPLPLP